MQHPALIQPASTSPLLFLPCLFDFSASTPSSHSIGRWKPVHYAVKRAYAPMVIQAILDQDTVDIFIVSDQLNTTEASVQLTLVSLNDTAATCSADTVKSQRIVNFKVPVPGMFASKVQSFEVADLLAMRPGCTATTCFLTATATAEGVAPTESQLWLVPFKAIVFPDPELRIESADQSTPGTVTIKVTAERPAALVMVSEVAPLSGHYNDNAFSINPCEPRVLSFTSHKGEIQPADLKDGSFYVESLFDHSSWSDAPVAGAGSPAAATDSTVTTNTGTGAAAAAASNPVPPTQHQSIAQMVANVEREEESPEEVPAAAAAAHPAEQPVFVAPGESLAQVKEQQPAAAAAALPAATEEPAKVAAAAPAATAATPVVTEEPAATAATPVVTEEPAATAATPVVTEEPAAAAAAAATEEPKQEAPVKQET
jgi:hypothetical protein